MLACLLCLQKKPKSIKMNSKKGKELNCSSIIAQHFWLKPNTEKDSTESVCLTCWDVILAFHQLYEFIAEAHNCLNTQLVVKDADNLIKPKEEEIDDILLVPEVKVEITELENLPQTEVIEGVAHSREDAQQTLNKLVDSSIRQTLGNISDNESETEIPLSVLKARCTSKTELSKLKKSSKALNKKTKTNARKKKIALSKNIKSTDSNNKTKSAMDETSDNGSNSSQSDSDEDWDSEIDATNKTKKSTYYERKKKSAKTKEEIKLYNETISKYFKTLKCSKCKFVAQDFDALKQHSTTEHDTKPIIICCERIFQQHKTLSNHVLTHLDPQDFTCTKCDGVFASNILLEEHLIADHRCSECLKDFPNKRRLQEHILVRHTPKSQYKFECTECDERFALKRRLYIHMGKAHDKGSSTICEQCGKSVMRFALKKHMRSHSGKPRREIDPMQCDLCGKWLKHRESLRGHKYFVHNERHQQQCPICNKTVSSTRSLENHIFNSHQKERKFKCPMCDKAFKDNLYLQQHINLHTKAVLYTCDICSKTFLHLSTLKKHMYNFHPNKQMERPAPLQCQICSAWLTTRAGLKQHIRAVHEGSAGDHRCHICKHVSVNTLALKRHIKRNHGIKLSYDELLKKSQKVAPDVT